MGGACRWRVRRGDSHKPRPEPKETSVGATGGQRHFIEGRGIDTRDVVRGERATICKKEKKAKNCEKKKEAAAASASTAPSS